MQSLGVGTSVATESALLILQRITGNVTVINTTFWPGKPCAVQKDETLLQTTYSTSANQTVALASAVTYGL